VIPVKPILEHSDSHVKWWPVLILSLLLCVDSYSQVILLVCIPGKQNTQQIQSGFDALLGPGKASVFGRIKDLETTMTTTPDVAIISTESFFNYLQEYKPMMIGKVGSQAGEKYLIISASKDVTMASMPDKKVGIVDFLGRDRLSQFIKDQFNVDVKLLKRVNKVDDLLTMLGMETVEAIVVSTSQYKEILSNTKLPLVTVATSEKIVGFAVCATRNGKEDAGLKNALLKSPASLSKEIGIDSWEVK
jgi:hypothetical protein